MEQNLFREFQNISDSILCCMDDPARHLRLLGLRSGVCLALLEAGCPAYRQQLLSDHAAAAAYMDGDADEAAELLALHFAPRRERYLEALGRQDPGESPFSFALFERGMEQVELAMEESEEQAVELAAALTLLSEQRNRRQRPRLHRLVVTNALWAITDADPERTAQLCDRNQDCFEGVQNYEASRFRWFYGFALRMVGRSEEAAEQFRQCHALCRKVEGEQSWIGARAAQAYHGWRLMRGEADAENALWDILAKIDRGFYEEMDENAELTAHFILYLILTRRMARQNMQGLLPQLLRFRDYCQEAEPLRLAPQFTRRTAANLLSAYYMESGDFLQAARHAVDALRFRPPEGFEPIPTDELLQTNLLLIYSQLGDSGQMLELIDLLADRLEDCDEDDPTFFRTCVLIHTAKKRLGMSMEEFVPEYREALAEYYEEVCLYPDPPDLPDPISFAMWVLEMIATVLDSGEFTPEEAQSYCCIAEDFLSRPEHYRFNDVQKAAHYMVLAQAKWRLEDPGVEEALEQCLRCSKALPHSHEVRISAVRFAAVVYHNLGRSEKARDILFEALEGITAAWQKAVTYLNDHKVCQLLEFVQLYFNVCCAILSFHGSSEAVYEQILRFKDLPALVGRERNRLLRLTPANTPLTREIFRLQDRLAAAQLNDQLQGTDEARALSRQLQELEAEFAARFPRNCDFTPISLAAVEEKLPEGHAILEYYFLPCRAFLSRQWDSEQIWDLHIFVTVKRGGKAQLHHLRLPDGAALREDAETFVELVQDPVSTDPAKITLRASLYRRLLAPVMPYLEGVQTLYLAPDQELCNLPFEILYADGSGRLTERFRVSRLVCGRDLLFAPDAPACGGCFILGAPDYEAALGRQEPAMERDVPAGLEPVQPLPFSAIEARNVARRCGARPLLGPAATKFSLQRCLPCRIIHLATHGVFDADMDADSLYSSHLVFAGYNRWVRGGGQSVFCGNGILTADEISRMDLKDTELVVLSACRSGLTDSSGGSMQGLISAFCAAGARWVVSHMWKANDFAAPILMDFFYEAYLTKGLSVPDALQQAKERLRTVTIGQLRDMGWLDAGEQEVGKAAAAQIRALRHAQDRRRPFADEYYWGGVVAHRCR